MAIDPNVVKDGVVIDKVTGIYGKNKLIAFMTSAKGTGATSMATTELFTLNDDGSYNATISTDYNTVKTINCEPGTYRFTGTKQNDANTTIIIINGNNYNWPALTPAPVTKKLSGRASPFMVTIVFAMPFTRNVSLAVNGEVA